MSEAANRPELSEPIAIIGMACIFAGASDLRTYWNNILQGVDAIGEPVEAWGARRYLDAGRIKTQAGGFLNDLYRFDPREFGIMPNSVDGGETDQFMALMVARDALADAGYLRPDADHLETGIVLGHSAYLHRGQVTVIQQNIVIDQTIDLLRAALPHVDEAGLDGLRKLLQAKLPPTNADNAPGLVPNMMTGRIANRLNLRGPNYVLDAACASSLLAVSAAIDELRMGRSRMMLAGGVNATLPADVSTSFTQLGALSARGRIRPFEAGSDGTLLGEGLGVVVLKRLDDALADGDRIYAVLRGVGQSSDGRGTGLLAPSHDGETLAMRRAYEASGVDPADVDLVEAHGTGIPLGDKTEIASLKSIFGERTTPAGVKALGSVKSMISHCIPAAGIASLIKMALALHHRILPMTLCEQVNPELDIEQTPFFVNTRNAPWMARLGQLRRAGVNSFGFGGINAHAIVEQAPAQANQPKRLSSWPAELCVLSAESVEALQAKLDVLSAAIARTPTWCLAEIAAALAKADAAGQHRLTIVARNLSDLATGVAQAQTRLREGAGAHWQLRSRLAYSAEREVGKLAFLFPGEGSQYPEMLADLAPYFPPVQHWLDFWHGLYDLPAGHTRTDIAFPSAEVGAERRAQLEQRLNDMDVGSEAVFIGGLAMFELLESLGVRADSMMGHSSGESAALVASGANPVSAPDELAACISRHFAVYKSLLDEGKIPTGALLAVGALPPDTVEEQLAAVGRDVVVAMDNCANQIVLYGTPEGIERVQNALTALGGICMPLPFDRGYHTPAFTEASAAFLKYYKSIKLGKPAVPLYSCSSVGLFPQSAAAVRQLAAAQWSKKVRFRETVLKMHDDGVRLFVEVGPSAKLSAFVKDVLIDREYAALPTNVRRRGGVEQVLSVLGQLYVAGRPFELARLFEQRAIDVIDLQGQSVTKRPPLLDNTMPMVRLNEDDRARVRELVGGPEAAPAESVQAEQAVPVDAPGGDEGARAQVMTEYFGLMRSFLDQQRTLVEITAHAETLETDAALALAASSHASDSRTPLLDIIVELDADHVFAQCRVGLDNDCFIRDHVLSGPVSDKGSGLHGLACVPFMVSLEIMAEACALLAGRHEVRVIENVKAFDWIALDDGALTLDVHAEVLDHERGRFAARIVTPRGVAVSAEFGFESDWRLQGVAPLTEHRPWGIDVPNMYTPGRYAMFHGPVFQSMREIAGWDDTGIDVRLSPVGLTGFFAEGHRPQLILNPVLLDALGQVVPCWLVQYVGPEFHSFPSTIGRIELYEACPADREGVVMRARQHPLDPSATDIAAPRLWQFECADGEGRVLLRGGDMVNLFFRVTPSYHAARTYPLGGWLGAPVGHAIDDQILLWQVPLMPDELCQQSGGICLRVLAHAVLDESERAQWRSLEGPLRRRREWLYGRAALKEAVRYWVQAQTGQLLYPSDIAVGHDALGAPWVDGWWGDQLIAPPRVSLSHDAVHCVVAVSPSDSPVGVDFEALANERRPELLADALAPTERSLIEGRSGSDLDERLLRLWCAKEAAAKCLGTGLQGQPWAFSIAAVDEGCEQLLVEHEAGVVQVQVLLHEGAILAVARLAMGQLETEE